MEKIQIPYQRDDTVSGEIIKVLKKDSKYGNVYYDVQFKLLETGSFYRSCIYTACRNFSNWNDLLIVGNVLSRLRLIEKYGKIFIDADSFPILMRKGGPEVIHDFRLIRKAMRKEPVILQMELF